MSRSLRALVPAFAFLMWSAPSLAGDCEQKCDKSDCLSTLSPNDDPSEYCTSTEGVLPAVGKVTVHDAAITLKMRWDSKPALPAGRGVEFAVVLWDPLLEPIDVQDLDPTVNYASNLPCAYRDVYNHTAGTPETVYWGLMQFCGMLPTSYTETLAYTLWAGIADAQESHWSFAVGSECPENIEVGKDYYFTYLTKRCEGTTCGGRAAKPETTSFTYVTQDGIPNWGFLVFPWHCPLTDGDSKGDDAKPPKLVSRVCAPTDAVEFNVRSGNTCNGATGSSGCALPYTECDDNDGDGYFDARRPAPLLGTRRDCEDCDPTVHTAGSGSVCSAAIP